MLISIKFLLFPWCIAIRCGNVNWSRRLECNICKAQKFTKVEQRSGTKSAINIYTLLDASKVRVEMYSNNIMNHDAN